MSVVLLAVSGSNLTGDVPFSAALAVDGAERVAASPPGARGDLAALVAGLCAGAGLAPDAIGRIRVDVGPGSYTGLRVACTFVRFLQHFGGATVQAVDSLALLAARVQGAAPARVRVVLDARRERAHTQLFDVAADRVVPVAGASAVPLPQLLADVRAGDVVALPASTPVALRDALLGRGADLREQSAITAAALLRDGLPFADAAAADLEPRYLMGSYAEA